MAALDPAGVGVKRGCFHVGMPLGRICRSDGLHAAEGAGASTKADGAHPRDIGEIAVLLEPGNANVLLGIERQERRVVKTGNLVVSGADVQQQGRGERVVIVEAGDPVMKEGAARIGDLGRQAVGVAVGSRVLAIGGRPGPIERKLALAAQGVIDLDRRNNGGPLAQVRTGAVIDQIAAGGVGKRAWILAETGSMRVLGMILPGKGLAVCADRLRVRGS